MCKEDRDVIGGEVDYHAMMVVDRWWVINEPIFNDDWAVQIVAFSRSSRVLFDPIWGML